MQVRLFKPRVTEEAISAAAQVMRSGWLGMGPVTGQFEKAFAAFVGAPRAVAVNTCTSALHLAVKLLRLPRGAEVITSPLTFVAANEVLLYEGLTPVFADIDRKTGNLTAESISSKITERSGAVMMTHFGGYACDLAGIRATTTLPVVEDCAHACGAWYRDQRVGGSGNLCCFSFDPIKNLTTGDGGMIIVPDESKEKRARTLRYMGLTKDAFTRLKGTNYSWEYEVPEVGYRYHMNDIAAAMGLVHLKLVDEDNVRREGIAKKYREQLGNVPGLALMEYESDRRSSHHLFPVLAEHREGLADKLGKAGIIVGGHYARNDVYQIFEKADVPNAEHFCSRVLTLPMHAELTDEEIEHVGRTIREGW